MQKKLLIYSFIGLLASSSLAALLNIDRLSRLNAAPEPRRPSSGAPFPQSSMMGQFDRHFIEMMIPHHQGAIDMAQLAPSRARHSEIKTLAASIIQDQTREIKEMRTWYKAWYGTDVPAVAMGAGMRGDRSSRIGMHQPSNTMGMHQAGIGMGGMGMGGMSMATDLAALKKAPDFDREFIRQMIPHHQMAIHMAQMLLNQTTRPEMRNLAQSIINSQTAEITQMQQWNQSWYR